MKQKKIFILAAAALAFAACSSDESPTAPEEQQTGAAYTQGDVPVAFDVYVNRGTTRAGLETLMTLDQLKKLKTAGGGFGVFSYYTNNEGYGELAMPNFMYNQGVFWDETLDPKAFAYAPIKYWPNEFGTEASSERVDYLTFFAYAPYVEVDPKTGKVNDITSNETGIIALTRNTAIGDPLVKYVIDFNPAKSVDLCWGVAAANYTNTVTTTAPTNNIEKDKPFIDVIKPTSAGTDRIKFNFRHALASLNVQIDADADVTAHNDVAINNQTRIYVRSVSFEGFTDKGALNLNSEWVADTKETPTWYNVGGEGNLATNPVTVYDGRYDGREGVTNVSAPAEFPQGLNSAIVQTKPYTTTPSFDSDDADPGVITTPVNLFDVSGLTGDAAANLAAPIYVIPNGQPLKVKIVYDVETYDPSLPTYLSDGKAHGSTIENAITKEIEASSAEIKMVAGKKYIVKLHLGLTSVKFDALVEPFNPTEVNAEPWVPENK